MKDRGGSETMGVVEASECEDTERGRVVEGMRIVQERHGSDENDPGGRRGKAMMRKGSAV